MDGRTWQRIRAFDEKARHAMREHGPTLLRVALGLVFVWFGALKIIGRSPVEDLVAMTLAPLLPDPSIVALGVVEVVVGMGLLTMVGLRAVLAILWLQLAGTFIVFLVAPYVAFQGSNPFLLTVEGEFIVKNVVLIAAGIVVGGRARDLRATPPGTTRAGARRGRGAT